MEVLHAASAYDAGATMEVGLEEVVKKIRLHCLQHRIRVVQFLHDFDKARCGMVTKSQFQRALHMSGLSSVIDATDYDSIFARYATDQRVNYAHFCEDVDEVFTKKRLEKNPAATTSQEISKQVLTRPVNTLTAEEANIFARVQQQCIDDTKTHGLVLKSCFIDFDTHRCGKVPHTQFERAVPFKLAPVELAVIIKKYKEPRTGHVNYLEWVTDVDRGVSAALAYGSAVQAGSTLGMSGGRRDSASDSAESLLDEIRKQVKQRRIRIADSMSDYDKLHTGTHPPFNPRTTQHYSHYQMLIVFASHFVMKK